MYVVDVEMSAPSRSADSRMNDEDVGNVRGTSSGFGLNEIDTSSLIM